MLEKEKAKTRQQILAAEGAQQQLAAAWEAVAAADANATTEADRARRARSELADAKTALASAQAVGKELEGQLTALREKELPEAHARTDLERARANRAETAEREAQARVREAAERAVKLQAEGEAAVAAAALKRQETEAMAAGAKAERRRRQRGSRMRSNGRRRRARMRRRCGVSSRRRRRRRRGEGSRGGGRRAMEREMSVRQSAQEEEPRGAHAARSGGGGGGAAAGVVDGFHSDTDGVSDAMVAMRTELVEMRSAHLASTQLYAWSHLFGGVSDSSRRARCGPLAGGDLLTQQDAFTAADLHLQATADDVAAAAALAALQPGVEAAADAEARLPMAEARCDRRIEHAAEMEAAAA